MRWLLAGALALLILAPVGARAETLSDAFSRHAPGSPMRVDHADWTRLLQAYVIESPDGVNRVDYAAWKASPADRDALKAYLAALQATEVSRLDRPEQFAFWANLYNALTLEVVLDHYPVASIRDISISPGLFAVGPWGRELVTVEGRRLSLDNIEHDIMRKVWRDPRVHYAVNCASIGCPNLGRAAFTGEALEPMLDAAARAFVNHPRGLALENGRLVASRIYSWFAEDFTAGEGGLVGHLRQYAEGERAEALDRIGRIASYRYDWALNGGTR